MCENIDKKEIYQLIEMYLSSKISELTFCNEFYRLYDLGLDLDTLTKDEDQAFYELSNVTCRFSEFEEDIKNYPGVYSTKEEIKKKIIETQQKLEEYFEEWRKSQK